jgi:hypothetical protein
VISGTVVGRAMVAVKEWQDCPVCGGNNDDSCDACDDMGGRLVETGEMREEDVHMIPWIIEDIAMGDRSQFVEVGEIPGNLFAVGAPDAFVSMESAGANTEIRFRVRYTGDKPEGEIFRAALIGTTIGEGGLSKRSILPICSGVEIVA